MTKRLTAVICLLSLTAAILSGCMQADEDLTEETDLLQANELEAESSPSGNILPTVFSLPYTPGKTLDPITCLDGMQQTVSSLLYESLFRLTPELEPEPYLCSSYSYDPDTYSYSFTLRDGIAFSDGSFLTADDVKATLQRAQNSDRYGSRLAAVTAISVADDRTLTVTLSSPNTGFPALLDIPIVKSGTETDTVPVGTGPYFFSQSDTATSLIVNQLWWQGDGQPTDRIDLVETSDLDSVRYRLTSHDIQLVTADLAGTDPIIASGNIVYQDAETTVLQYVGLNLTKEPMSSQAFRSALSQGLQRSFLVNAHLSGHAVPAQFPVSPVSSLYPTELEKEYSSSSFTEAVARLEYTDQQPLSLLVNAENTFKVSVATELAALYTKQGIPMEVNVLPWAEYTAALAAGNFDLYYGEVKLTADWDLSALLASGGTLNYGSWSSNQTDTLLTAYKAAENREQAMAALCSHLQLQNPILPICFARTSVLMQSDVLEGLTPTAAEPFYGLESCVIHLQND